MFRKPVQSISQGDRAGVCVTQFDPKLLERGLVCTPGSLPTLYAAIVTMSKIAYYAGDVTTKSKFHVTIGHSTVMAKLSIFGSENISNGGAGADSLVKLKLDEPNEFDFSRDYIYQDELKKCVVSLLLVNKGNLWPKRLLLIDLIYKFL